MKTIPLRFINTNPKALNDSENFSIRDIRELTAGKDLVQDIHRHDFFFILALRKGKGEHTIDFTPYKITNCSIFFMRPGQVHQLILKAGSAGYLMQFNKDFYSSNDKELRLILRKAGSRNFRQLDAETFKKLFLIMTGIFQESVDKKEKYSDVIKASLGILLIELVRHQQKDENDIGKGAAFNQDRLEEFSELLDIHISINKQASQYAEMLNLTPYQLNTITKSALGKTSSELINEQIILESKRYLLSTSTQVKEIAYHLGYEDASYFIRFFKKHTGLSPETFRRNFR
jgi:AraC family transcriptional regulator, transcriptional activator of pobA